MPAPTVHREAQAPSLARGLPPSPAPERKDSLVLVGGAAPVPPPSMAFVLRFASPRAALGGLLALSALRCVRATRVRSLRSPLRALAPVLAAGGRALAPSGARAGGWPGGVPPSRGGRSRRPFRRSRRRLAGAPFGRGRAVLACWGCVVAAFSSVPSAAAVVLSARCALAPWAGSALGVSFRPSARALFGAVAVVRFASAAGAGAFARSWSRRLPPACRGVVVRPVPPAAGVAPSWAVSVPVAPPPVAVGRGRASRRLAALVATRCGA